MATTALKTRLRLVLPITCLLLVVGLGLLLWFEKPWPIQACKVSQYRKEVVLSGQKGEAKNVTQFQLNQSDLGDRLEMWSKAIWGLLALPKSLETFQPRVPQITLIQLKRSPTLLCSHFHPVGPPNCFDSAQIEKLILLHFFL